LIYDGMVVYAIDCCELRASLMVVTGSKVITYFVLKRGWYIATQFWEHNSR